MNNLDFTCTPGALNPARSLPFLPRPCVAWPHSAPDAPAPWRASHSPAEPLPPSGPRCRCPGCRPRAAVPGPATQPGGTSRPRSVPSLNPPTSESCDVSSWPRLCPLHTHRLAARDSGEPPGRPLGPRPQLPPPQRPVLPSPAALASRSPASSPVLRAHAGLWVLPPPPAVGRAPAGRGPGRAVGLPSLGPLLSDRSPLLPAIRVRRLGFHIRRLAPRCLTERVGLAPLLLVAGRRRDFRTCPRNQHFGVYVLRGGG